MSYDYLKLWEPMKINKMQLEKPAYAFCNGNIYTNAGWNRQ